MWILWVCNSPKTVFCCSMSGATSSCCCCATQKTDRSGGFNLAEYLCMAKMCKLFHQPISQNFWQFAFTTPPILGESGCVTWLCYHLLIFDPMYMYIFTHVNMYACIKTKTIYVYLQVIHICMYIYLQKWYTKVVSNDVWSKKTHSHMSTRLKPPPAFPIGIRTESIWHVWKSGFPPSKSPWGLQVSEKIKKHWLVVW